jgi:hypothetical protein
MRPVAYSRPGVSYTTPIQRQWVKRRGAVVVQCVQQQQQHATSTAAPDSTDTAFKQAVLYTKFKAHDAAVTALAVLKDEPGVLVRSSRSNESVPQLHTACSMNGGSCTRMFVQPPDCYK